MAQTTGEVTLRKENVERIVNGFALQEYKFKQLVMTQSSSAWQESYYQETAADLTNANSPVKGVPRLANFPYGEVSWTKKDSYLEKYGMEGVISWEDATLDNIDVVARTLLRIARAVTKAVDAEIWDVLTVSQAGTGLSTTVTIPGGSEWDSATVANRDPIQNILDAIKNISENDYDALGGNGFLAVSPKDYANLLGNANVRNAGQFYTSDVTKNGKVGKIVGLNMIVSNNVTDDYALVGVAKECGTWKAAKPLTVVTIEDPGIKFTIRAWEVGVTQLTNPQALCLIANTQA